MRYPYTHLTLLEQEAENFKLGLKCGYKLLTFLISISGPSLSGENASAKLRWTLCLSSSILCTELDLFHEAMKKYDYVAISDF